MELEKESSEKNEKEKECSEEFEWNRFVHESFQLQRIAQEKISEYEHTEVYVEEVHLTVQTPPPEC